MKLLASGFEHVIPTMSLMDEGKRNGYVRGNRTEMEEMLTQSKRDTPVATGNLKNSGYLEMRVAKAGVKIEVGHRADYAVPVHENLAIVHENGKAKFLEDALNAASDGYDERVAMHVLDALSKAERGRMSAYIPPNIPGTPAHGDSGGKPKRSSSGGRAGARRSQRQKVLGA